MHDVLCSRLHYLCTDSIRNQMTIATMVKAKKQLGQHFLRDSSVAERIAATLESPMPSDVLELGPGTGALTRFLLPRNDLNLKVMEIDAESVEFLEDNYPELEGCILKADFLKYDLDKVFDGKPFTLIGNFPYNISSQIFFRVLENPDRIPVVCGMLQKEVAERLASPPGNKNYGILSVLLQAWYDIEYLFSVPPSVFNPPPKVMSGVIRMRRNNVKTLPCDGNKFRSVVKMSFNQRRKTLRNSLKPLIADRDVSPIARFMDKRAEQLSVADFIELTKFFE